MHIASIIDRAERLWPHQIAVVCGDHRVTYAELAPRCRALARALLGSGLSPGDRVAVLQPNTQPFVEATFATALAGLVLVPVNTRLAGREIAAILAHSGARLVLAHLDHRERLLAAMRLGARVERVVWTEGPAGPGARALPPGQAMAGYEAFLDESPGEPLERSPGGDELAHLVYTSGTTGEPKGVMLTHANIVIHAWGAIAELRLSDADVWAHVAPMFHLADSWATVAITAVGGRHVMVPRFDPQGVLRAIRAEEVTLTNLVPTMLNDLVHHPGAADADYPSLRVLLSGGAPIAPRLVRRVMDTFGCDYIQTYGMTETSPYLTVSVLKHHMEDLPEEQRFRARARTGRAFLTVDLRVVDDRGEDVPADDETVGEIIVRGPTVSPGYFRRPEETAAAHRDGWLHTGDLAVIDAEGYVDIVDRRADVIITGGENVYSTEVEHVLAGHPDVVEAAVVGAPDERWGEVVTAFVVLAAGAGDDPEAAKRALVAHCRERLAGFKCPRRVAILERLPRTGSGKIAKTALRDGPG